MKYFFISDFKLISNQWMNIKSTKYSTATNYQLKHHYKKQWLLISVKNKSLSAAADRMSACAFIHTNKHLTVRSQCATGAVN